MRPECLRCRRPRVTCLCAHITPRPTRARFVILIHPREYKRTRNGTGRLTHLSLTNSELHVGVDFRQHPRVRALLADPHADCWLLYPGPDQRNLSRGEWAPVADRAPVVFLVDGTWACVKTLLARSENVRALPRLGFDVGAPSEFAGVKSQPRLECLATIEATHRALLLMGAAGHEDFGPAAGAALMAPFRRLVAIQRAAMVTVPDR